MIKETLKKIHFVPYTQKKGRGKDTSDAPTALVSMKRGTIAFASKAIKEMDMNNKFVRFFYEPTKRIVGWKIEETVQQEMMKEWKLVKASKSGTWLVSVRKLLEIMKRPGDPESYSGIEIQKYREKGLLVAPNDVYYYIQLKADKKDEDED